MPLYRNKSGGPRILHVKGPGDAVYERVLAPGEAAEFELANAEGQVEKGMIARGELEVDGEPDKAPMRALSSAPDDPAGPEAVQRAALDSDRRSPPRQFGGDGGPEQMPTVDGRDGEKTRAQEEGPMDAKEVEKANKAREDGLRKAEEAAQKEEQSKMAEQQKAEQAQHRGRR